MINPYKEIKQLLLVNDINYEEVAHEHVYTSEQAAAIRGFSAHQGAKSLLLKADGGFVQAIIPGDMRLDNKKLRDLIGAKHLRFATPEEVEEMMGCKIGSCYPFGNLIDIPMFVDKHLGENETIAFSPGRHDKSIKMRWEDYKKIVDPKIVDVTL